MRRSKSYVGTFDVSNRHDMNTLQKLRESVSLLNKTDAFGRYKDYGMQDNDAIKKRVVARGRKPIWKIDNKSYDWGGNIVGGIRNASVVDVYIYDRR